jgi:hypothetical protein
MPHHIFTYLWVPTLWIWPGPLIKQTWFPFIQGYVPSLIKFGFMVLEKIFKNVQCIFTLSLSPPLGEHLNKLESHSLKDDLFRVWLKLVQWFWKWRLLNDPTPFLYFCDYLLFEEDMALSLNKLEFPSPKDNLYYVWLNLACWFWRRRF